MTGSRERNAVQLSNRLNRLSRSWRQEVDFRLLPLGLSYAKARTLLAVHHLGEESPPRQTDLAARLEIVGPSLVRLLDELCDTGVVTRNEDPKDRRAKIITPTPKGVSLVETTKRNPCRATPHEIHGTCR